MPKIIMNMKKIILPLLLVSLLTNITLLLMLVPIDSVTVGCSISERRLSLLGGDRQHMIDAKANAEEVRRNSSSMEEPPNGIAYGVSACNGLTYKLYIL